MSTLYLNLYACVTCGIQWSDGWTDPCDDDCPRCGTTVEPDSSEVLGEVDG